MSGAVTGAAGAAAGAYVTAQTGGCFVCGYAAGSLVATGLNSAINGIAYGDAANLGVGPVSYQFGDGPNRGFNVANPTAGDWSTLDGAMSNIGAGLAWYGAAQSTYSTYGAYRSGSLFREQWKTPEQFHGGVIRANQAANADVVRGFNWITEKSGFDFRIKLGPTYDPSLKNAPDDGVLGKKYPTTLRKGATIDRYGDPEGLHFSPKGSSFGSRSLPFGPEDYFYNKYRLTQPMTVDASMVLPWHNQTGLGTQYVMPLRSNHLSNLQNY